jgi:ParB family chromosome partitioning protein
MTTTTDTTFEVGTTHHLPPSTLRLERNIRDAKPDAALIESVKSLGVLEPVVAVAALDGGLIVRSGHRRVLAAIEAGLDTVAVYVADVDDLDQAAEVGRIIRQRDENTHRAGLSTAEEVGAVSQLAMFGLSVEEISKQARIGKDRVETAVRVSESKMAREHAEVHQDLTLDQAAAIAEFEDEPETVVELVNAAAGGRFEHTVQRKRDHRAAVQAKASCVAQLEADGVKVVERPDYSSSTKSLERLVDAKGKKITRAAHAKCAGHVAWPERSHTGIAYKPEFGCTNPTRYGHRDTWSSSSSKQKADDMTEAQRAAAKQERRLVIENNKAWGSAQTVRREWLASFAKVKTPPKGAAAFIATSNTKDSTQFDYHDGPGKLCVDWLSLKTTPGRFDLSKTVETATEARALVIALVYNLALYEDHLSQQAWRMDGTTSAAGRYLRFLASCGYQLSEVEEFAISKKTV